MTVVVEIGTARRATVTARRSVEVVLVGKAAEEEQEEVNVTGITGATMD